VQAIGQLDPDARRVMALAEAEAQRPRHGYLGTEHVLVALLLLHESDAGPILAAAGLEADALRTRIDGTVNRAAVAGQDAARTTRGMKRAQDLACAEASAGGRGRAAPDDLLLGLIEQGDGVAAHVLADLGVTAELVRELRG
jgi:ATP-dependent Clp protease ATP-binding subunit ClpC